ncbi:hypothetical protein ABZ845_21825 [Streptomyces sp. NPDC047022]|uniref:hypothetical protein n=1 Tax=Streptomyces sp. NPDC047022 TaxID=3155737 RepID=UPI0033C028D6
MDAQETTVDINGMKAAVPHFESAHSQIHTQYQLMYEHAAQLPSVWSTDESGGQAEFTTALHGWLENCETVQNALKSVIEKLNATIGGYERAHASGAEASSQVKQSVGAPLPGF